MSRPGGGGRSPGARQAGRWGADTTRRPTTPFRRGRACPAITGCCPDMTLTLALLLTASTPLLAATFLRRRRMRLAVQRLGPGLTVAYGTIARSRRRTW